MNRGGDREEKMSKEGDGRYRKGWLRSVRGKERNVKKWGSRMKM